MKLPIFKGCKIPCKYLRPTVQTIRTADGLPDLKIRYRKELGKWEILTQFVVTIEIQRSDRTRHLAVCIPKHFLTDFASVPELFWSLVNPFDFGYVAPIVHDRIYNDSLLQLQIGNRLTADRGMLALMRMERVECWKRTVAYSALRFFGKRWA